MPVEFPAAVDLDDDDDDDDDDKVPNCSGKESVTDVLLILFPSLLLVVRYNHFVDTFLFKDRICFEDSFARFKRSVFLPCTW